MTDTVEKTPLQKFHAGVGKALRYGDVFVQGEAVRDAQDAETKVKAASQEDDFGKWSKALLPGVKIPALSTKETAAAQNISALLASLTNTLEGRPRHVMLWRRVSASFVLLTCMRVL
jgi:hypothetical protein